MSAPLATLQGVLGAWAGPLQRACRGQGGHELGRERPAFQEFDPQGETLGTISNERTFREDILDPSSIHAMLCSLCERVCYRARKRGVKARTVTLKLRYADFQTLERSRTFTPTASELEVLRVVLELLRKHRQRRTAIRLLGVRLSNLEVQRQLTLFDDHGPVHRVVDGVRQRFGYDALHLALAQRDREHEEP